LNKYSGKAIIIKRSQNNCFFDTKLRHALAVNVSALIAVNDWTGAPPRMRFGAQGSTVYGDDLNFPICMTFMDAERLLKRPGLTVSFEAYRCVKSASRHTLYCT
jgi:hypothetical protein